MLDTDGYFYYMSTLVGIHIIMQAIFRPKKKDEEVIYLSNMFHVLSTRQALLAKVLPNVEFILSNMQAHRTIFFCLCGMRENKINFKLLINSQWWLNT